MGISLGCPLSPLIGALFLNALDVAVTRQRLFYVRFIDDILILAPTRWQLRGVVKTLNQVLGALGLEKHPDKTFIGRIECGFDFLGYHFSPWRSEAQALSRTLIEPQSNHPTSLCSAANGKDMSLAKICKRTLGITTMSQKYFRKAQTALILTTVDANGLACMSRLRLMGLLSRTNTVLHTIL